MDSGRAETLESVVLFGAGKRCKRLIQVLSYSALKILAVFDSAQKILIIQHDLLQCVFF